MEFYLLAPPMCVAGTLTHYTSKHNCYNRFVRERFQDIKGNCPDLDKNEIFYIISIEWKMKKEGFTR